MTVVHEAEKMNTTSKKHLLMQFYWKTKNVTDLKAHRHRVNMSKLLLQKLLNYTHGISGLRGFSRWQDFSWTTRVGLAPVAGLSPSPSFTEGIPAPSSTVEGPSKDKTKRSCKSHLHIIQKVKTHVFYIQLQSKFIIHQRRHKGLS